MIIDLLSSPVISFASVSREHIVPSPGRHDPRPAGGVRRRSELEASEYVRVL